jgi:hypothetical protein
MASGLIRNARNWHIPKSHIPAMLSYKASATKPAIARSIAVDVYWILPLKYKEVIIVKAMVMLPRIIEKKFFPLFTAASKGIIIDIPLQRIRKPPHQGIVEAIRYNKDKGAVRITEL